MVGEGGAQGLGEFGFGLALIFVRGAADNQFQP